jgi:hypothetical protein
MTQKQVILSLVIVAHLTGLVVGAIPALDEFGTDSSLPRPAGQSAQSVVTASLDQLSVWAVRLHRVVYAATRPLQGPVRQYLNLTDQYSKWNMFSNPAKTSDYVRLDFLVRLPDGTRRTFSEFPYPAAERNQWRFLRAYFASFVDKAFANGMNSYQRRPIRAERRGLEPPTERMRADLLPFVRYYARRRAETLPAGSTMTTQFWRGWAQSASPGEALPGRVIEARLRSLEESERNGRPALFDNHTIGERVDETDSDISWYLWVVDELRKD